MTFNNIEKSYETAISYGIFLHSRSFKHFTVVKHKIPRPYRNCKACDDDDEDFLSSMVQYNES